MNLAARVTPAEDGADQYRTIKCLQCEETIISSARMSLDDVIGVVVDHFRNASTELHAARYTAITRNNLAWFEPRAHGIDDPDALGLAFKGE
jgi:hypothetical protein